MKLYRNWLRLLANLVRNSPGTAALLALLTIIAALQPAGEFRAFWGLIDAIARGAGWRVIGGWLAALAVVMAAGHMSLRTLAPLRTKATHRTELVLTRAVLERAVQAPLLTVESPAFHDRLNRATTGIRERLTQVIALSVDLCRSGLTALSVLTVMAGLHWGAALVLVLAGIPGWLVQTRMSNLWVQMYRRQTPRARYADYLSKLLLQRRYAQEVRLFQLAPDLIRRWRAVADDLLSERIRVTLRRGVFQVFSSFIGNLAYVFALGLIALATLAGRLTLGAFAASIKVAQDLQEAVLSFMFNLGQLHQDAQFAEDLWSFLGDASVPAGAAEADAAESPRAPTASAVQFQGVSFRYPGADGPSLRGISFTVEPGEMIALVGENGAGKSTLVKLLLGLYQPDDGAVTVDGADPGSPAGAHVRPGMASVFQEHLKYALTAAENVGVGEVAALAERPRIALAAAAAGAAPALEALPMGYDTQLGREFEGGQDLSGGQWQKVAIARAYMRTASLLVLDEPTAALDPEAEVEVFRQFRALARERTAFFISHRLGAARLADRIFVLKDGQLVEAGHHDDLLARGGEYAALFGAQAHWYR